MTSFDNIVLLHCSINRILCKAFELGQSIVNELLLLCASFDDTVTSLITLVTSLIALVTNLITLHSCIIV